MCILSEVVKEVAKTKIFTCLTEDFTRQFLVYSNQVDTPVRTNLMILPVPNPETVEFIDLSDYPGFFEDCQDCFVSMRNSSDSFSLRAHASLEYTQTPLPVHSVGSYVASIVPSSHEFHRLDRRQFIVSDDLVDLLSSKYGDEFGFILCKLKQGNHAYHPFAYLHKKHSDGLLFIPTFHYHPHHSHSVNHTKGDWDHVIYSVGTDLDTTYIDNYRHRRSDSLRFQKLPPEVRWIRNQTMNRWSKHGLSKNMDLWIAGNLMRSRTPIPRRVRQQDSSYEFPFTIEGLQRIRKGFGGEI